MPLDLFSRKLLLLVEDEPLIALDVELQLRKAGARVITAGYLDAALSMTDHPDLSGAVVDLRLGAESADPILSASRSQEPAFRRSHWLCHRRSATRVARGSDHSRNRLGWIKLPTPLRSLFLPHICLRPAAHMIPSRPRTPHPPPSSALTSSLELPVQEGRPLKSPPNRGYDGAAGSTI